MDKKNGKGYKGCYLRLWDNVCDLYTSSCSFRKGKLLEISLFLIS